MLGDKNQYHGYGCPGDVSRGTDNAITVTSEWARWCLKSPVSRLFAKPFVHAQIKENTKAPHPPVTGGFPHIGPVTQNMFPFDDVIMAPREGPSAWLARWFQLPVQDHWPEMIKNAKIFLFPQHNLARKDFFDITVTSHEYQISNLLDCLFNSLFRPTTKTTSKLRITGPLWGESNVRGIASPHKGQ